MRPPAAAAGCRGRSSIHSRTSSGSGGSSGVRSSPCPQRSTIFHRTSNRGCSVTPRSLLRGGSSQQQAIQDPPSAYQARRQQQQQFAHGDGFSSAPHNRDQHQQQQPRWPRPVDDVCKAISKRLKQADSYAAVLQVVQHHAAQFNTVNTSLAYAQLARHLRFETSSSRTAALQHSSYAALQALAVQQAGGLNPRQVAMVLTSLAWMAGSAADDHATGPTAAGGSVTDAEDAVAAAAEHPLQQQQQQQEQQQEAPQQQQQQELLLQLLSQRLHVLLDDCEPDDTCHCLWALTRLDGLSAQLLGAATAHGVTRGWIGLLTAKPLSSLLWVHAQAHLRQQQLEQQLEQPDRQQLVPQLVCSVMHELAQPGFLATWTPQELSVLLWSCAVLGVPLEQQQGPGSGAAAAAVLPVSVLQEVCQLAQQHVVQFTPQGIAMVCWSLARLLTAAADSAVLAPQQPGVLQVLGAFTAAAAARLHYYKPQEVANIFSACSRLQVLPAGLQHAVGGYVCTHAHLLGCRDVTELLMAGAQQQPQQQGSRRLRRQCALDAAAVRALLHRLGHLLPELSGFQLAAAAWACTKLAQQQGAANSNSGGSSSGALQDECLAVASQLLDALGSSLMQSSSPVAAAAAADGLDSLAGWDSLHSQLPAGPGDLKQAVALAWALAAASADGSGQQQQQQVLLSAVLARLQQGLEGLCDGPTLVQVLCVVVRLNAALCTSTQQQQPELRKQLQQVQELAVSQLQLVLPQLSAAQAVTAAWATVRLQLLQQGSGSGGAPAAVAVLSGVLHQLHEQQQLGSLPAHAVSALLWCCRASGWAAPAAINLHLLTAADARLLQMPVHQQVLLLQSVADGAAAAQQQAPAAEGSEAPHLVHQLHQQQTRLAHGLVEQLQLQLHQQAQRLDWQQRRTAATSSRASAAAVRGAQHADLLQPHDLLAAVASCRTLLQLQPQQLQWDEVQAQATQLLQQAVEVWQMLLQRGSVQTRHALLMVWHLADLSPDSPAQPWHIAVVHQLKQQQQLPQQQHQQQHALSGILPKLLQHAVYALHADCEQQQQQAVPPSTLVLALRVFARLDYQPPARVLSPLLQQLEAALPALSEPDITAAVVAAAHLALPASGLTAAAVAELAGRQRQVPNSSSSSSSSSSKRWLSRPGSLSLNLLWAVLSSGVQRTRDGAAATSNSRASAASRLLLKAALEAADVPVSQLLQQPQLLLASQQAWRMLSELPQFKPLQRSVIKCRPGQPLPKEPLLQQLRSMTWLLLPKSVAGRERRRALLHMLHASQPQLRDLLLQRLGAWQQQQQGQQALLEAPSALLPLWLQFQMQKQCCQLLARELVVAQLAAGCAAARVNLRLTPTGEVVLLLRPQQPLQQQGCKGLAVVLEGPASVSVNTGSPLGPALTRDALLQAEGFAVQAVRLQAWLPDYLAEHQHSLEMQQAEAQPRKQQHLQHQLAKRMRRLRTERARDVQRLVQLLAALQ